MNIMKAGNYYVGDLCYVMADEWREVCDLIIDGNNCKEGIFQLKDGREFAIFNTMYGDGQYSDNNGFNDYCVDSGSIGCILLSNIDMANPNNKFTYKTEHDVIVFYGNEVEFKEDFEVSSSDGKIVFGDLVIDTAEEDIEPEDDWNYESDDPSSYDVYEETDYV